MTAPRFTIRHDDRPAVELQDAPGGILITTFGWPRTLSGDEAIRLHAALGALIAEQAPRKVSRSQRGAAA